MNNRKAKTGSTASKGKPSLIAHPLFPAMVAIWFGALFGLGSLAIRPTLLESLVVSSRIDLLVPAAAPPLGMTARILLALVLAGAGGLFGATIARRIARPRPEKRERSRTAASVLGRQTPAGEVGRRRALTVPEEPRDDFEDRAPLPGGAPQILNVHDVAFDDVGGFADHDAEPHRNMAPASIDVSRHTPVLAQTAAVDSDAEADELDLAAFPDSGSYSAQHPEPQSAAPFASPANHSDLAAPQTAEPPRFKIEPPVPIETVPSVEVSLGRFAAPRDEAAGPVTASPLGRLGDTSDSDATGGSYRANPDMQTRLSGGSPGSRRLFDAPPEDTFAPEFEMPADADAAEAGFAPPPLPDRSPLAMTMDNAGPFAPMQAPPADEAHVAVTTDLAPAPGTSQASQPASDHVPEESMHASHRDQSALTASDRIGGTNLGELSQVELVERLAIALRDRRQRRSAPAAVAPVAPVSPALATSPAPSLPDQATPTVVAAPAPVEIPVAETSPIARMTASFELPAAPAGSSAPDPVATMPAALRPIGFDPLDDLDDAVPAFVPPRHIAMPAVTQAEDEAISATALPTPAPLLAEAQADDVVAAWPSADAEDEGDEESRVLEDGYSSLLNLSRPAQSRPQFVRIEEPEEDTAPVEPVVIFPGQGGTSRAFGAAADSADSPNIGQDAAFARPFDAPARGIAQAVAAAPVQDPEETERALRAALASLQRMSGAA